jgi:two-component system sensor histidine kinase PilS (NtrC family)
MGIIAGRLVVSSLLLGSAVAIGMAAPDTFPVGSFVLLIAITYALSLGYLLTVGLALRRPVLLDLQFALDAVLVAACIYLTGGIASHFSSLFILPIVAASTVQGRRGGLQVAGLGATLYVGIVTAQYLDVTLVSSPAWRPAPAVLPGALFAQYTVSLNLGGMFAVALLAGSLAERLRSAHAGLEDASYQIADLRAFNERVIDALPSGLLTADATGRILTFNPVAARITGVAIRQAIGRDVRDVLQLGAEPPGWVAPAAGPSRRAEIPYRRPGGESVHIGLTTAPLQFPEGTTGLLVTFQDITGLKQLELDARRQQRLSAVGEMAAGIAHEIRNPLAAMSGSIEVLRQDLPLLDEQRQLLDIVLRESERLNETIRLFVAYARPSHPGTSRLDVRTVLGDAALALRSSVDARSDHTVTLDVPEEPVWYDGDDVELRQVFWSLGTNALRAMPHGGPLTMRARLEPAAGGGGELVIAVEDRGCGIPADQIDQAFQPFRAGFPRGAGLGLAIVHRIVTDYGGRIEVVSSVGIGTTVHVRLPLTVRRGAGPAQMHALPAARTA